MRMTTLPLALLLVLCPSLAQAKVNVHINIGLPLVPPLVVVQPGIQVVEGFPEEVFLYEGMYWCRRPDGWYRAHSPRERFDQIRYHRVPVVLRQEPVGYYRNWHHDDWSGRRGWERDRRRENPDGPAWEDAHHGYGRRPFPRPHHP